MAAILAAFITHVCACVAGKLWVLLIAGILFVPLGVAHGAGLWFGAF